MSVKKIVAIILAVVAVVMVGFGIYTMNSSKYIFKTALSGVFDTVVDSYDELTNELEEYNEIKKYKITSANSLNVQGEEFATIDANMYVDISSNRSYFDLDSAIVGEDFIGLEALVEDDKVYLKFKEVIENFYYSDIETTGTAIEGLEDDEFELLMNHLENSILKDISDKDLEKSSQTLKLGDKSYKTTKVALNISEKRLVTIVENLLTSISNDNKAIQILQKFDKTITKESIQELLKSFEDTSSLSNEEILTLAFYVEGFGTLRRVELSMASGEVDGVASNYSITFDIYNNKGNKTYLFTAVEGTEELFTIKSERLTDSTSNVAIVAVGFEISGTIKETEKELAVELNIITEGVTLGTISYKDTVVSKNKEYKTEIIVNVPGVMELTSNNTLLVNEEIPDIDVSDAVYYEEMTEEDSKAISDYINEKMELLGLSDNNSYGDETYWGNGEEEGYSTEYYDEVSASDIEDLINSETPEVVWFGQQGCSHCEDFALVLDDSYWDYDYFINYVDIANLTDSDRATLKALDNRLNVTATPTVVVLQDGEIKDIHVGSMTKDEYYDFLDSNGVE